MDRRTALRATLLLTCAAACGGVTLTALAQNTARLDADAARVYHKLIAQVPAAKGLSKNAVAVLVFPKIIKAGLVFGGQYGEGVLLRGGKPAGYYGTAGASYGLQAGAQQYGYALFFMNEGALSALTNTGGFEIGTGPSVVVVDQGMAKTVNTMTLTQDIYAFIFSQKGLMAGVGLQGNKITKLGS